MISILKFFAYSASLISFVNGKNCYEDKMSQNCPLPNSLRDNSPWTEVFDLSPKASSGEVQKCYKELSVLCHPDKTNGSNELQVKLNNARDVYLGKYSKTNQNTKTHETSRSKQAQKIWEKIEELRQELEYADDKYKEDFVENLFHVTQQSEDSIDNIIQSLVLLKAAFRDSGESIEKLWEIPPEKLSSMLTLQNIEDTIWFFKAGVPLQQLHVSQFYWRMEEIKKLEESGFPFRYILTLETELQSWILSNDEKVKILLDKGFTPEEIVQLDSCMQDWLVDLINYELEELSKEFILSMDKKKLQIQMECSPNLSRTEKFNKLNKYIIEDLNLDTNKDKDFIVTIERILTKTEPEIILNKKSKGIIYIANTFGSNWFVSAPFLLVNLIAEYFPKIQYMIESGVPVDVLSRELLKIDSFQLSLIFLLRKEDKLIEHLKKHENIEQIKKFTCQELYAW